MPTNIYLCAAAYQTADGGALAAQCPAGSGPDIDPGEFFVIPTAALHDNNGNGKFDRLDPALGFTLQAPGNRERRLCDQLGRHAGARLPGRVG